MFQWFLSYRVLLLLFHFGVFLLQLSELVWKLTEGISLQSASKLFPSFGSPAKGNKSKAKNTRFRPNRNLTETIYYWSVDLRGFSVVSNPAKRDANGFLKALLLSLHLLVSCHSVRKSRRMRSNGNTNFVRLALFTQDAVFRMCSVFLQ